MRIAASFCKQDQIRFVSHLDMQRLFQRAFRRAKLPLAYSKGFNPHPLLSFATALSVGYTSECEYFDVMLDEDVDPNEFVQRVNSVLPIGVRILSAKDISGSKTSLTTLMRSAEYFAKVSFQSPIDRSNISRAIEKLLKNEISVMKNSKSGPKLVDIRPLLIDMKLVYSKDNEAIIYIKGKLTAEGGLPVELLLSALSEKLRVSCTTNVNRKCIEMDWTVMA